MFETKQLSGICLTVEIYRIHIKLKIIKFLNKIQNKMQNMRLRGGFFLDKV